ncbi:uncharacterized protein C8Q71DRAFT_729293 [Rhodofomes roseus]|uniref:C2H2-type domain-containing protein n=1 Tax=Rhodofomes roseus TaxID=34475 RepID=A0ABQ8KWF7_9APHY|nr:uncharacterized protein C8Q71DRAFT_729293 [Rhodofomes roseus]KAH9843618.1 hypothetical protein C8Q71DRAFT_729293 [Rhodofomes roseus]
MPLRFCLVSTGSTGESCLACSRPCGRARLCTFYRTVCAATDDIWLLGIFDSNDARTAMACASDPPYLYKLPPSQSCGSCPLPFTPILRSIHHSQSTAMPRSASSECVSLPSIHELLPEHFCRPLDARSLEEPRSLPNMPLASIGRMSSPSRHIPFHTNRSSQPPSRNPSPRTHTTLSPTPNADHNRVDDKRHACPFCPRRFNRPSSLAIHLNTHTGAKPYACPACGRQFSVNSNMRRHYRNHFSDGQRSGTLRSPRLDVHQPVDSLDRNVVNANVNMTPYRYPPLAPPTFSRSTTPSAHSETQYSDSDQDSLVSSPPMHALPAERMLQGSFAARNAEWGGSRSHPYVVDRMHRSSRSASLHNSSLYTVTSSVRR